MTVEAPLAPLQRKALRARAHPLEPVVWIGGDGLTAAVLAEIERALAAHELIKVRAAALGREARDGALAEICARCGAQPVQHIGKVLVIYRKKPDAETPAPAEPASRSRVSARASRPRDSGSADRGKPARGRRRA